MKNKIDISVIVAIYGAEKYIEKALRSLFSQTKTNNVEFILVNDATKDQSMVIARQVGLEYSQCTIIYIDLPNNGGVGAARQAGMDHATGEYTIHVDPDDWCEPTMLEDLYRAAKKHDADMVCCDCYYNRPNAEFYAPLGGTPKNGKDALNMTFNGLISQVGWDKLIRRSLYVENNILYKKGVNRGEDVIVNIQLFQHMKSVYTVPAAYYHYRSSESSITKSVSDQAIQDIIIFVDEVEKILNRCDLIEEYKIEWMHWKLRLKQEALQKNMSIQEDYCTLFLETTPYISSFETSNIRKFALYQASKKRHWLYKLIICSIDKIKRKKKVAIYE